MKLLSTLSAILFATVASMSFGVYAEDAENVQPKKMMKPHSRLEEKTGVAAKPKAKVAAAKETAGAPEAAANEDKVAKKDQNANHFHPRDGK